MLEAKIVGDWIRLQHLGSDHKEADSLWPAWEAVEDAVRTDPDAAWNFILEVLNTDRSDQILQSLSAGPLEDLLSTHGEAVIARVESEARKNPLFAKLLGGVWQLTMSEEIWNRVQAVWDRRGWDGAPAA